MSGTQTKQQQQQQQQQHTRGFNYRLRSSSKAARKYGLDIANPMASYP